MNLFLQDASECTSLLGPGGSLLLREKSPTILSHMSLTRLFEAVKAVE